MNSRRLIVSPPAEFFSAFYHEDGPGRSAPSGPQRQGRQRLVPV